MLRIEGIPGQGGLFTLRLAGRLVGAWVRELARECERVADGNTCLALDLAAVSFVDRDGAELLRGLARRDVTLLHCSPFVAEQLGTPAS